VNLFVIHLLGDAASPTLIGKISDRTNLQIGFLATVAAVILAALVLFYGMRFAPTIPVKQKADSPQGATA
jgi:fucose permease